MNCGASIDHAEAHFGAAFCSLNAGDEYLAGGHHDGATFVS